MSFSRREKRQQTLTCSSYIINIQQTRKKSRSSLYSLYIEVYQSIMSFIPLYPSPFLCKNPLQITRTNTHTRWLDRLHRWLDAVRSRHRGARAAPRCPRLPRCVEGRWTCRGSTCVAGLGRHKVLSWCQLRANVEGRVGRGVPAIDETKMDLG